MLSPLRALSTGAFLIAGSLVPPLTASAHPAPDTNASGAQHGGEPSIACPIAGESTFDDSWGAPRSGGRRHEGVDLIADRGTPVVAVQSGDATFKRNRLGGNAVWITTDDGHRFYYAHLDRFEGESRAVVRGEVIGYVGSTGNAKGPHLHFETHFEGSVGNPFEATAAGCSKPALADLEMLRHVDIPLLPADAAIAHIVPGPLSDPDTAVSTDPATDVSIGTIFESSIDARPL